LMSAHKIAMRVYRFYAYRVIYAMHLTRASAKKYRSYYGRNKNYFVHLFFPKKIKGRESSRRIKKDPKQ